MDIASIQKRLAQIEQIQQETKAAKEMLKSELESEPAYMEAVEEAKAIIAKRKRIKDEILGKGPNEKLMLEIADNNEEMAALKQILTAELVQHYSETKEDEIPDASGVPRKFQLIAKVLPKGSHIENRNHLGQYTEEKS